MRQYEIVELVCQFCFLFSAVILQYGMRNDSSVSRYSLITHTMVPLSIGVSIASYFIWFQTNSIWNATWLFWAKLTMHVLTTILFNRGRQGIVRQNVKTNERTVYDSIGGCISIVLLAVALYFLVNYIGTWYSLKGTKDFEMTKEWTWRFVMVVAFYIKPLAYAPQFMINLFRKESTTNTVEVMYYMSVAVAFLTSAWYYVELHNFARSKNINNLLPVQNYGFCITSVFVGFLFLCYFLYLGWCGLFIRDITPKAHNQ